MLTLHLFMLEVKFCFSLEKTKKKKKKTNNRVIFTLLFFIQVMKIYLALFRGNFIFINTLSFFSSFHETCSDHLIWKVSLYSVFKEKHFPLEGDWYRELFVLYITHIFDCRLQKFKRSDGWSLIYLELIHKKKKQLKLSLEMTLAAILLEKVVSYRSNIKMLIHGWFQYDLLFGRLFSPPTSLMWFFFIARAN